MSTAQISSGTEPLIFGWLQPRFAPLAATEAARIIGCSTANVRYLRARGVLPAHRAGSRWLYPAAPVVDYAERRASRMG
ncbi:DNA-binding protein [Mycobacterium intracellulare subsp. chimaera]|nr:DNA-binding protein [Mycobacterium intracellulare subsp. chimaera]PBA54202.1 DNA-binding protein [Mycobacterium intracellulare subsp. chimaera]PBA62269.1 DNA-binding protein [Mycobacterium intracellulare subsp. chimaera]